MLVLYESLVSVLILNVVSCVMEGYLDDFNNGEDKIFFPDTRDFKNQEIPLDVIRRLNMLSNTNDFLRNMVESEPIELSARLGENPSERGLGRTSKTGKCMPEYTTVYLKPDKTTTTFYYPRCARVKRCGGCCLHDLLSCRPIEKEFVSVTLAIAEYKGGHQFRLKERKIVQIEQHTQCECGCKVQPEDCTKFQKYNRERCKCECANNEEDQKCYKKIWNPDICSCMCRYELTCGSGFEFDPFTCNCVSSGERKKPGFLYKIYI